MLRALIGFCILVQAPALQSRIIGPIGPFTPFRSDYVSSASIDNEMQALTERAAEVGRRFGAMSVGMTSGNPPAPETMKALADELESVNDGWRVGLARLQLAEDFQAIQFFKLVEAQMEKQSMTFADMQDVMAFQVHAMRSFAAGDVPTMSPPLSLIKMQQRQQQNQEFAGMPSLQMDGTGAWPFIPEHKSLTSPIVRAELDALTNDNKRLVKMGSAYRQFDRGGKHIYLDQIESVEERWRIFIGRFELMGALSPEFIEQQDSYLRGLQIGEVADFEDLLERARRIMREDADRAG